MTRLTWADPGTRLYETGLDRGVLYVDGIDAVPWSGLISVEENPVGGEARGYYQDGQMYLQFATPEGFQAQITAFYSPAEFDLCDGVAPIATGFYATQQARRQFGLSYRSKLGNDLEGSDHAYKIHLIYNALATPAPRTHNTMNDSPEAETLSWNITTKPIDMPYGLKPSAHLIIDTTKTYPGMVEAIEDILYGANASNARLPGPEEVAEIIGAYDDFVLVDNGDGTFTVTGRDSLVYMNDETSFTIISDEARMVDANTYTLTSND